MVLVFIIAFFLSFIGSLPFGMINMAVANIALQKGVRAGVFMGAGAAIVEMVQVFIALKFTWLFSEGGTLLNVFQVIAVCVFFTAGIYFLFFAKPAAPKIKNKKPGKRRHDFIKGVGISSLNLMVIPYWMFYGTLLTANGWMEKDNVSVVVFSVGAMFGVFLLLVTYAYLGDRVLRKSERITKWVNKFIGVVLVGFGVYQLIECLA